MHFQGRSCPEEQGQRHVRKQEQWMRPALGVPGLPVPGACLVIVLGTPSPGSVAVEMRVYYAGVAGDSWTTGVRVFGTGDTCSRGGQYPKHHSSL